MTKQNYIYLFELDSLRESDAEILLGLTAVHDEIVQNGNAVVLTYEQLVDSRAFFSLMEDRAFRHDILQLFRQGGLRIAQQGDIRTAAQYLLGRLDDSRPFLSLPLRAVQGRLIALVRRSLLFSDLSELRGYLEGGYRSDEETDDLFAEAGDAGESPPGGAGRNTMPHRRFLHHLYGFLSFILQVSLMPDAYIAPRRAKETAPFRFHRILRCALQLSLPDFPHWKQARSVLQALPAFHEGKNDASRYLRELHESFRAAPAGGLTDAYPSAEAVIELCHNYVCEIRICNTAKRYDVNELRELDSARPTFAADFKRRLQPLRTYAAQHFRQADGAHPFLPFDKKRRLPDFARAARLAGCTAGRRAGRVSCYEYAAAGQGGVRRLALLKKLFLSILCLLVACGMILIFLCLLSERAGTTFLPAALVLFALLSAEWLSRVLSRHLGFLPLSEALGGMYTLLTDTLYLLRTAERTPSAAFPEVRSQEMPIQFVKPEALRDYQAYRSSHPEAFTPSAEIPIADTNDRDTLRELVRFSELHHQAFGVIHQSRYNTVLVDPVTKPDGTFYPFERVLPTAGNGIVIVARRAGKFILLRQYRHALRKEQYSFPRGYAEPDATPAENVRRELTEELHAVLRYAPQSLGFLEPDSGLTSRRTEVFLAELDDYAASIHHEGILEVREASLKEMKRLILDGILSDGYTIGALELWRLRAGHKEEQAGQ